MIEVVDADVPVLGTGGAGLCAALHAAAAAPALVQRRGEAPAVWTEFKGEIVVACDGMEL